MTNKFFIMLGILAMVFAFAIPATFAARPVTYYTLTVTSYNPASNVAVTVSPPDKSGAGNGTTPFTRSYAKGTVVNLTAPATANGNNFWKWQKGIVDYSTTQATSVTMSANTTMTVLFAIPASAEQCKDGVDNDLDGRIDCADSDCTADSSCTGALNSSHAAINAYNGPATCIACHGTAGNAVLNSMHGSWLGPTPNVPNIAGDAGKWGQTNNYCTDPQMADYACLKCHVSLVAPLDTQGKVDMSKSKLTAADMDCMQCHSTDYRATFMPDASTAKTYYSCVDGSTHVYIVPKPEADGKIRKSIRLDLSPTPGQTAVSLARTVTRPNNATCLLKCHAKAGGSDGAKRGDLGSDMVNPPVAQDVHLSSAGVAKLTCTACHAGTNHQIPGRGNDMRGEDTGAAIKKCVDCHTGMDNGSGHANLGKRTEPDRHVARVDCTACHIDVYGKGIGTELSRDWTAPYWNPAGCEGQGAYNGHEVRGTNVVPEYRFWNKTSWVFDRNGTAGLTTDPIDGGLAMSLPLGGISDGKLYPFKVHTSKNPIDSSSGKTNFDVLQMFMTGCFDSAATAGLNYIGETGTYAWTENKAFQLITHGVAPAAIADNCSKCHGDTRTNLDPTTVSKMDKLGYKLKDTPAKICSQCHSQKTPRTHESMHGHINKGSGIGCYFCHSFQRPERNLCDPCDPACVSEFVDTNPYPHVCN